MADYAKIQGSGKNGDFVLTSQGTAVAEGFRNVSQYWYPQTTDYDAGFEAMEKDRQTREDLICSAHDMLPIVDQNGKFAFAYPDGREFVLDEWSVTQYAAKMGVPVTMFNWLSEPTLKPNGKIKTARDDMDSRLLVACVRNGLRHVPKDKKFRFRTYNNSVIRAVLSQEYAIVDNRWYLDTIRECIPGGRLSHWRGDGDTMYGNVLIPDSIRQETDSEYGGMISIGNCEIGKRRLSQTPSVFRAICMNGCIWDQTKGKNIRQVHRGKIVANLSTLKQQIAENIQYQIPLMSVGIDRILKSQEWAIDNIKPFIAEVAIGWGLKPVEAREVVNQYLKFESGSRNVFGVVNAMTRASQTFDPKRWVEVDMFAGEIIGGTRSSFDRMLGRANNLSTESVDAAFGLAV